MRAFIFKPTAIAVALALSVSSPLLAQQAPAGASKASSSAVGGVSAGTIGAAVAVVAAAAALSGGSGGASSGDASSNAASAATQATAAASEARRSLDFARSAQSTLTGQAGFNTTTLTTANANGQTLFQLADDLQIRAAAAASNLAIANTVAVAGVVNPLTGVTICAAANTCTAQEKLLLAYDAARLAQAASQALFAYLTALENASLLVTDKTAASFATATAALTLAKSIALLSQIASNAAIEAYKALATSFGIVGTALSATTGTTGSIGATATVGYIRGSN